MQPSEDKSKIFHSNDYARVASGNKIGATADVSFIQRQAIDKSRQIVSGYDRSTLGNSRSVLSAKKADDSAKNKPIVSPTIPNRQQFNSDSRSAPSKPPKYNPYA